MLYYSFCIAKCFDCVSKDSVLLCEWNVSQITWFSSVYCYSLPVQSDWLPSFFVSIVSIREVAGAQSLQSVYFDPFPLVVLCFPGFVSSTQSLFGHVLSYIID